MKNKRKITLLFILLLGFMLRFYQLGKENFYATELGIVDVSFSSIFDLFKHCFSHGQTPFSFIFMHYWIKLFGTREFFVRIPSAIFGSMSVYIIFLLGRKVFNEKVGLLASYLFAVSIVNIYHSQLAKPYSMATFFVLLSFLFFIKALNENSRFLWLWYVIFTEAAIFTHITVASILLCQVIFIILLWKRYNNSINIRKVLSIFAIILCTCLPLIIILLISTFLSNNVRSGPSLSVSFFNAIIDIFNRFGGKITEDIVGPNPTKNVCLIIPGYIFSALLFLLCLRGINVFFKSSFYSKKETNVDIILLILWLLIPIFFQLFLFFLTMPMIEPIGPIEYILYISCSYYVFIGKGIMCFNIKIRRFLLSIIVIAGIIFLHEYYSVQKRTDWKGVCNYIKENIREDEKTAFIISNYWSELPYLLFYKAPNLIGIDRMEKIKEIGKGRMGTVPGYLDSLEWQAIEDLEDFKGIWLAMWRIPRISNAQKEIVEKLKANYIIIQEKRFIDTDVYHFELKKARFD